MHEKTVHRLPHHPSHKRSISKQEIMALPHKTYGGPIHLIDSDEKMGAAVRALAGEKVMGFDTETRPAFKVGESYPPSLIQLAAHDRVYLFHLRHIHSHKPFADFFGDRTRLKAGIAVTDDIKKLKGLFHFEPKGVIELADMAAKAGIKSAGIRTLAALLFRCRISKAAKCSRWDAPALTHDQIVYAATDAWMCREIYFALLEKAGTAGTVPKVPSHKP
jgi:ribonuclease D